MMVIMMVMIQNKHATLKDMQVGNTSNPKTLGLYTPLNFLAELNKLFGTPPPPPPPHTHTQFVGHPTLNNSLADLDNSKKNNCWPFLPFF